LETEISNFIPTKLSQNTTFAMCKTLTQGEGGRETAGEMGEPPREGTALT